MSWFVDASVIVAMVGREPDWQELADRLDEEPERLWSPISRWESIVGSCSRRKTTIFAAEQLVEELALLNGFKLVEIGEAEARGAIDAMQRYGRGSGSKAKLNMGDCFAYACAKTFNARLLYKGDDFACTDMAL